MKKPANYIRLTNPWLIVKDEPPPVQRCTTPQGPGHVWPYTPLAEQMERGRLCVILDGCTDGAKYYNVDEVMIEGKETTDEQ